MRTLLESLNSLFTVANRVIMRQLLVSECNSSVRWYWCWKNFCHQAIKPNKPNKAHKPDSPHTRVNPLEYPPHQWCLSHRSWWCLSHRSWNHCWSDHRSSDRRSRDFAAIAGDRWGRGWVCWRHCRSCSPSSLRQDRYLCRISWTETERRLVMDSQV